MSSIDTPLLSSALNSSTVRTGILSFLPQTLLDVFFVACHTPDTLILLIAPAAALPHLYGVLTTAVAPLEIARPVLLRTPATSPALALLF
jgi:hypothetical protein